MGKRSRETRFFKIQPETDKEQVALDILYCLKEGLDIPGEYKRYTAEEPQVPADFVTEYLNVCVRKELLKISGLGDRNIFEFNTEFGKILGIGFRGGECFLTVMDIGGNIVAKENIRIDLLLQGRTKNKDINGIIKEIADQTGFRNNDFACAGVAVPEEVIAGNPRSMDIFARGIGDIFKCEAFLTTSATGAGYGDREFTTASRGKDLLYMYSDVGIGVILKKELIFEADEYDVEQKGAYLRPWNQFSVVRTTKDLVSRGVGTDIVRMVKGNIDGITLDVVLKAAENKDALAEDLVKRSGLALGVRVAYLVNMFRVGFVLFGGGIEKKEVHFIRYVKESLDRFLSKDILNKLEIIPGVLGKESSSVGAALLCRREIFMGV